jgi:hypothetical protein
MAQIFHRSTNMLARVSIYGGAVIVIAISFVLYKIGEASYFTNIGVVQPQPVPFSHRHHTAQLGIDCRYCHTSVEDSSFAGLPPTATCITCHSEIWRDSPTLEPVRASYRTDVSLAWTRVNALPEFVYFDHSIHVHKGVGCTTCHGPVGEMALTWRAQTLQMSWCLDCHRAPEKYVRRREDVFLPQYEPPSNQLQLGAQLVATYHIQKLTDCATCHR